MPENFESHNLEKEQEEIKQIPDAATLKDKPKDASEDKVSASDAVEQEKLEKARQEIKSKLFEYLDDAIKDRYYSAEKCLEIVHLLQQKFNIPFGEIEADPEFQDEAKKKVINMLYIVDLKKMESIMSNFAISDEIYSMPEFQKAVRAVVRQKLFQYISYYGIDVERSEKGIEIARFLQQKFNIHMEEIEADSELQEVAKKRIITEFHVFQPDALNATNAFYDMPEFQKTAREVAIEVISEKLFEYLEDIECDRLRYCAKQCIQIARLLQQKFNLPYREIKACSELQEKAKKKMLKMFYSDNLKGSEIYEIPEFQEAAKKAIEEVIISKIKNYGYQPKNLQEIFDIKKKFSIDDQTFAEFARNLILEDLKSGNLDNMMKTQEIFSISDEKLLTPEYAALAEQALVANFERGDRESIEKIKEKFLPDLDTTKFIQDQYTGCFTNKRWDLFVKLKSYFPECEQIFQDLFTGIKNMAKNNELPFSERHEIFDMLAGLAENGEASVSQEFSEIISARTKQKKAPDSKWGLDPLQESAFHTVMRLDNPDSNNALFGLAFNENVNSTVKYAVLKKLLRNNSSFLNNQSKENLHIWLYSASPKKADWRDMQFVGEIQKIPSAELRDKSLKSLSIFKNFDLSAFSLYKTWSEKYSNIPQNVFLQVLEFCWTCESEKLLDKFQKLFTSIRKESSKKDNLLYGITNVLEIDPQILKLLGEKLETLDFGSKQDANLLSKLFRQVAFLNKIEQIKNYRHYDNNEDNDDYQESDDQPSSVKEQEISPKILEIFDIETKGIEELNSLLKKITTKKIQEILPNENITAEKIEAIEKEWGDLEPIFTYLGRFPQLKEYVAEIVAHVDTAEGWKNWRYDLNNEGVKKQIGHLSEEQLEIWKGDYFSEIGDIMVAETGSDKPRQIQHILQEAILQHRHIFNPEMDQNKNEFVSKTLEAVFAEMAKTPDKQSEIIGRYIIDISSDARSIDAIINFNNLPRVRQGVESVLSTSAEITPSSKIKNTISFISVFLPAELRKVLEDNYSRLENQKKMAADEFFTSEMKQAIEQRTREIEENYKSATNSNIWEKFQLDKNNPKNLEQFYQKRQELKSATDLLRLLDLSNKFIATNRIVEKEGKKGGETITSVLERLKKYFKDSPLVQDISNVEFVLKEKIDFGEKRRLAMIFTDNAQMLWQAGKYPLGNGSCQHYAEGSYANQLMGYVGDPNCKVAYLVDLNRLPQDVRNEIEEKSIEEVKDGIPKQDFLNASLARSIMKMTRDQKNKPVILIEPTYTVAYKDNVSMDRYFNLFINLMVAEPMKAKMARGGGNDSVTKGHSLSPEGQYEDLDLNGVEFIHKLSKPTKEEMEITERIRSSRQ